ncbi:MAG: hypothetical protein MJ231_02865 [bacterium]|nr:hypothetical protein [bacterium]
MYILPVNLYSNNRIMHSNFTGITNVVNKNSGALDATTSHFMRNMLRAYKEIEEKFSQITPQGRKEILAKLPNFEIKDSMMFLNCGDEKYPIIINRASDYHTNRGLVKIVTRKGSGEWTRHELRDSFVVENEYKPLKDGSPNNQRYFPAERAYLTQEEVDAQQINSKLIKIFADLDQPMLEVRKCLTINMNKYLKTPDGVIPYDTNQKFMAIQKTFSEISELYKEIPKKRVLELKRNFPNFYLVSGQQYPVFQNLGKEQLTIGFAPVESSKADGVYRMQVYDKDGVLKRVFTIQNNKFIKNAKEGEHLYLPDFFTFVDSNEINEERYLPEFRKYLTLFENELNRYKSHANSYIVKLNRERVPSEFSQKTTDKLTNIHSEYKELKSNMKKLPPEILAMAKGEYKNYKQPPNGQGIIFQDFEQNKEIYYLPVRSNQHANLLKIFITDTKTSTTKSYLIHEDKYVVKNYNPSYTTLPRILTYMTSDELEEVDIEKYLGFIEEQMSCFKNKIEAYHSADQVKPKTVRVAKDKPVSKPKKVAYKKGIDEAQKAMVKDCLAMLKKTLTDELDFGLTNLDVTLSKIKYTVQKYARNKNN